MKKTFIIIYSVVASLVLIFALSFLGVKLYQENQHGDLRTQVRFEKSATAVSTSLAKNNISSQELIRQIENAIGDTKDYAYIKIVSQGKTVYVFPSDYDDSQENSSSLIINYKKTLANNSYIKAGLYSLRPASISYYTKITFFIILIVTLVTIILIILNNRKEKKHYLIVKSGPLYSSDSRKNKKEKRESIKDSSYEDEEDDDDEEEFQDEENSVKENIIEEADKEAGEIIEKKEEPLIEKEKTEAKEEAPVENEKTEAVELPSHEIEPVEIKSDEQNKGLFSPLTGLGWESYLMTRMDNELKRATASELDLALFIINIPDLDRDNPLIKKVCEYLTLEFQFKDLLFEYKEDCICALKISLNIDDALALGEKIIAEIKGLLPEKDAKVYAGITSRGIRMVSAERLLKEADEALVHAKEDASCPVVGFRADAVKYRKFIESK